MAEDQPTDFPATVPVMVLPGALLFPHALLPLYIFEPRYRAMLSYCLANERMFCVALMRPGATESKSTGDFFQTAGCGLIRACVGKDDGTANLILQGLWRVRLVDYVQVKPFRIARVEQLVSEDAGTVEAEALGTKVLELCRQFKARQPNEMPGQLDTFLAHLTDLEMLSDLVAHTFVSNPFLRQTLLEQPLIPARLRLLIQYLNAELK